MTPRPDLPRIKPKDQPTYLNKEAGLWGSAASFAGAAAALAVGKKASQAVVWGTTLAGTALGAVIGKQRMEREQQEGRVVVAPTIWNSGFWSGSLVSGFALGAAGMVTRVHPVISLVGSVGGTIAGMVIRKNAMERDYHQALGIRMQYDQNQLAKIHDLERQLKQQTSLQHPAAETPVRYKDSVTTEESEALVAKQEARADSGHAARATTKEEQLDSFPMRN